MIDFKVEWSEAEVARVLQRVKDCRLPPALPGMGWNLGCDAEFLNKIQKYWVDTYDWRAAVATLNRYPQFKAEVDGLDIHFVHVVGEAQGRRPLLLTHGWPGSHFEFWDSIDALAYPSRHGGRAEDAFDLIIPSLPGFGFSGKPQKIISQRATAVLWNKLMTEVLGYKRYRAQGGDWGAIVTSWLGLDHGNAVEAIHLNMLGFRSMDPPQNEAEQVWAKQSEMARGKLGGYAALQMTKPQSLAWAVADNPLGQAAWILERFHDWSDLRQRSFEEVFSMDHLLTNIMIYVMTGSFASAACYYPGVAIDGFGLLPHGQRCQTPTAYADFSGDASQPSPPRSRVELTYDVKRWSTAPEGGHFAAMEAPAWFVEDVRAWAKN
ncbi:epoxide hydrolase family protein [Herminiimonas arsenitoxidans]|uniref:epoxide hydrolase family protein n=1 Tax=Herminiimonas arsenitoxidans TaxID=1809410 RepID=UPI00097064C5|nr:epoxide hydrolase family protein [Herminiimonas arsenitoxidans]